MLPFPYNLLAVVMFAVGVFFTGWTAQGWHRDSLEKNNVIQQIADERSSNLRSIRREETAILALNAARGREAALRSAALTVRTELDGLRVDVEGSTRGAVTIEACHDNSHTLGALLEQCASRYSGMAETAQGHANDAQALSEAWPVK